MDDWCTEGACICLILCSGAIHLSDAAPLLKKLSCRICIQDSGACLEKYLQDFFPICSTNAADFVDIWWAFSTYAQTCWYICMAPPLRFVAYRCGALTPSGSAARVSFLPSCACLSLQLVGSGLSWRCPAHYYHSPSGQSTFAQK